MEVCLLGFKLCDCCLDLLVFLLLIKIAALHILFRLDDVVNECLSNISCLFSQCVFQGSLLVPESLNLLSVEVEFFCEGLDCLFESVDLALESGVVHGGGAWSAPWSTDRVLRSCV